MNWEVIDTKASKLTMEKEGSLSNLWVDLVNDEFYYPISPTKLGLLN